jgi:DHA3 family macrolide efflux protein-like MFS transporter
MKQHSNRNSLWLLFTANGISGFAQGVSMLAIPWYFARSGEMSYYNTCYGIITFLVLFFGLYAGTLVDKYSRKANFLVSNLVAGFVLLAIAAVGFYSGSLPDILVISVFAVTMLSYNIHYPTLYAFGQEITEPAYYHRLNSNIEIVGQSTSVLSGAFAAILLEGVDAGDTRLFGLNVYMPFAIPEWNIWEIFLMDAITYFISAMLIYFIRYTANPALHKQIDTITQRVKAGFVYLKQHTAFLIFGIFSYAVFAMLIVEIFSLLPAYVETHLHEQGSVFAMADGIYALGALGAGLFVNKVFASTNKVKAVIILTLVTAAIFFWMFASKAVWVVYIVSLILGFTNAGIRVLRLTYLFNNIPNELMGRVNSIFNMANVLTRAGFIFLFSTSFFTFGNHVIWAYFVMSIFLLISALVLIFNYNKIKN